MPYEPLKQAGIPTLLRNVVIYEEAEGKLIGWEQSNDTVVLFSGNEETAGEYCVSFPINAVPDLIKFLQAVNLKKEERNQSSITHT